MWIVTHAAVLVLGIGVGAALVYFQQFLGAAAAKATKEELDRQRRERESK